MKKLSIMISGLSMALSLYAADSVVLFNGTDFSNWQTPAGEWCAAKSVSLDKTDPRKFVIEPGAGIMVNGPKGNTTDIFTKTEHGDVQAHIEFIIPKNSNSGVYFQGRYEVQVYDSFGVELPKYIDCGAFTSDGMMAKATKAMVPWLMRVCPRLQVINRRLG
jgi:hypothetical protein